MNKQFRQIKIQSSTGVGFTNSWSSNLINSNELVLGMAIYGLPGTTFQINQLNAKSGKNLVLNSLGMFQIDAETRPITGLFMAESSYDKNFPVIIDLIVQEGVNLDGQ